MTNQNTSIASINQLSFHEKRDIFIRFIPEDIFNYFKLSPYLVDSKGRDLLKLKSNPDGADIEICLYHQFNFEDPVLYAHLTDTMTGQLHILLYIMNDPASPRYNVDRMPDGTSTRFGIEERNLEAEIAAYKAGLLPGQVRGGLHLLAKAEESFEEFAKSLGHTHYFAEPLYYHNAVIFEKYGFKYQTGRRLMEAINAGFSANGELSKKLDGSTFRPEDAANSIRLRSWAIHDGILGQDFDHVTMYKKIGEPAQVNTAPGLFW